MATKPTYSQPTTPDWSGSLSPSSAATTTSPRRPARWPGSSCCASKPHRSGTLGGWLYVTAKHEAYRILQQRAREDGGGVPVGGDSAPRASDPFEALTHRDQLALMRHLSAPQRLTVSLRAAGYSYKEISAATGRTYTWVNRHLTEGTAKLQQLATQDE